MIINGTLFFSAEYLKNSADRGLVLLRFAKGYIAVMS